MSTSGLRGVLSTLPSRAPLRRTGRLVELTGVVLRATLAGVGQGELVEVGDGSPPLVAEVVGFRGDEVVLLPLGSTAGLRAGAPVAPTDGPLRIRVGDALLGRVVDGLGVPIDGAPPPTGLTSWDVDRAPPAPLERAPIRRPLQVGVRAMDALLTMGEGQRIGLFAGSGVGKSTLLAQLARGTSADVVVVGLVGERGREVAEFLEDALGPEGRARSVVVAATSEAPAVVRLRAAHVATAIAEWFSDVRGKRVLLLLDSVTRFARAQREVGRAAGEPPARHGYPPSVFAELPRLLERAGVRRGGTITAIYTVLVAGGDLDEPIADEVRGLLDGHVVLDRGVAERGRFPAIDVLRSVSRVMTAVAPPAQLRMAARVRQLLAVWERQRELITIGAYVAGADPDTDEAIARIDGVERFLSQRLDEASTVDEALRLLEEVLA